MSQLLLPLHLSQHDKNVHGAIDTLGTLTALLSQDLDCGDNNRNHGLHTFHSFPAKFPPQLPRKFIQALTHPGDIVLDPMVGSGTTVIEAFLSGRHGIGFDIDPLALLMAQVKVTPFDKEAVRSVGNSIVRHAVTKLQNNRTELIEHIKQRWDQKTQAFIEYWFAPETQLELVALITEIEQIPDKAIRAFFELVFSAIIITKSGGVTFALDLAHTRPHRAKIVKSKDGEIVLGETPQNGSSARNDILTKTLRSAIDEFAKRFKQNLDNILEPLFEHTVPQIEYGNAQALPLCDNSVDLIFTSPPYASNAIDYMRAHKFSLVWLGHSIDHLGQERKRYIGSETITGIELEVLPGQVTRIVQDVEHVNKSKGNALYRYYSEMTKTLREMFRVLKPGKSAIVVVGNSILSGKDTQIQTCLAEIGQSLGFQVPKIGVRKLDRNRRMLPVGFQVDSTSVIQQRMHEEYLICFYKP